MNLPNESLSDFLTETRQLFANRREPEAQWLAQQVHALAPAKIHALTPAQQPVCGLLPAALELGNAETARLLASVARLAPVLAWERAPADSTPAEFYPGHAYCMIAGDGGFLPAPHFMLGLFLIAPGMNYPNHAHAADELYCVIAGRAAWQRSGGAFETYGPGEAVIMPSMAPHAIRTGAEPVLILWAWSGDVHGRFVYLTN